MRIGIPKRQQLELEHEETIFPLLLVTTLQNDILHSIYASTLLHSEGGKKTLLRLTPTYIL